MLQKQLNLLAIQTNTPQYQYINVKTLENAAFVVTNLYDKALKLYNFR